MPAKTAILEKLGETAVLLPSLIANALAANDRIKLRLTLLQTAASVSEEATSAAGEFDTEFRALRITEPDPASLLQQARVLEDGSISAPGLSRLEAGILDDLATMLAPFRIADPPAHDRFAARTKSLGALIGPDAADRMTHTAVAAMTGAPSEDADSVHSLVMDLHKALNRLAADTAVETLDGARVHGLADRDRRAVQAFMRGINRTAPLAFGHPGLATTAVAADGMLTIQNDIGATDAHVVVIHVGAAEISVTYTDIHRRRTMFFESLFEDRTMQWQPLSQKRAKGFETNAFYLLVGRFRSSDDAAREAFLEFLGSRIVFLIDWNRARKALRLFAGRKAAAALLVWAARNELGHRAFLELGGAELIFEAVAQVAEKRIAYGMRLDQALGQESCRGFLQEVLRTTSEGLQAGRTARLIRDEIRADLARHFETAETSVCIVLVRHLGLSRMLATSIADVLGAPDLSTAATRLALAQRAKSMEEKADQMTVTARDLAPRLRDPSSMRAVIDEVEAAMDALEDCAYTLGLVPDDAIAALSVAPVGRLSEIVAATVGELVRALEATIRLPKEEDVEAVVSLQAIDAVIVAEQKADLAERETMAALLAPTGAEARTMILGLQICHKLEVGTDHLAHAALSLRERVLAEFAA